MSDKNFLLFVRLPPHNLLLPLRLIIQFLKHSLLPLPHQPRFLLDNPLTHIGNFWLEIELVLLLQFFCHFLLLDLALGLLAKSQQFVLNFGAILTRLLA